MGSCPSGFLLPTVDRLELDDVRLEDLSGNIQQLGDLTIAKSVKDDVALPARVDQVLHSKDGQLLRYRRAFGRQGELQLGDAPFAVAEELEDADPSRMGERLEELGLKALQRTRHIFEDSKLLPVLGAMRLLEYRKIQMYGHPCK